EVRPELRQAYSEAADRFAPADLLRMLGQVAELDADGRFRKSGQQRILIELLLLRFTYMEGTVSLEEVLQALGSGGGGPGEGAANPAWGRAAPREGAPSAPPSAPSPRSHAPAVARPASGGAGAAGGGTGEERGDGTRVQDVVDGASRGPIADGAAGPPAAGVAGTGSTAAP